MENEFNTQPEEQANEAVSEQPAQASKPSTQQAPKPDPQPYAQPVNPQPQQPYIQQFPQPANTRLLAMLLYWGSIISLIMGIAIADRSDPFIKHHLNQMIVLFIGACISVVLTPFLIGGILGIVVFVFSIMATIDAYHGLIKPLPLIGSIKIIK